MTVASAILPGMSSYRQAFIRLRSRSSGAWLVHPELKARLVADARAAETNMTEVATTILAAEYGIACTPGGYRRHPSPDGTQLNLRLPAELYRMIRLAAIAHDRRYPAEIVAVLHDHYGLEPPAAPPPRQRTPAAA